MSNIVSVDSISKPKAPWIGVGESGEWSDVRQAMADCDLDFHVESCPVEFSYEENVDSAVIKYYDVVPGFKANVRQDTHVPLGCVSDTYRIVQNEDIFDMLTPFIECGGTVTNAGMTNEGLCFMIVEMQKSTVGGDGYTFYLMATNSFNGRFPASLICTPVRIICQNMYRQLAKNDVVARFRHSLNIGSRLEAVKAAYEVYREYMASFTGHVEGLKQLQAAHTIDEFVEYMFPYTVTDESSPRYQSSKDRIDERRAEYVNKYYYSSTNSDFGTCFALVNAYYDYVSHEVPVRKIEEDYRSSRFSKIVAGTAVSSDLISYMKQSR